MGVTFQYERSLFLRSCAGIPKLAKIGKPYQLADLSCDEEGGWCQIIGYSLNIALIFHLTLSLVRLKKVSHSIFSSS